MKYRAYKLLLNNGNETFRLMPLNRECIFVEGLFFNEINKLVLINEKSSEKFDLIEKFNPDGSMKLTKNNQPEVERLRVSKEYVYELMGDDLKWFIDEYVVNKDYAHSIVSHGISYS